MLCSFMLRFPCTQST